MLIMSHLALHDILGFIDLRLYDHLVQLLLVRLHLAVGLHLLGCDVLLVTIADHLHIHEVGAASYMLLLIALLHARCMMSHVDTKSYKLTCICWYQDCS